MINEMKALSMAESEKYVENEEVKGFIKKFAKLKEKDAEKLRAELGALGNIKIREEHIAKIIDILPEDSVDINKIFSDISLDENEAAKILEIVKQYK